MVKGTNTILRYFTGSTRSAWHKTPCPGSFNNVRSKRSYTSRTISENEEGRFSMMKLSTMRTVDSTVDTHGGSPIAEQILTPWDHEQGSVRFFRSSANLVYRFRQGGKPCFLRFASTAERTGDTIEAEIDILQWVAKRGMTVTSPLPSRNGNFVETVATDLGIFHAVVFAGLEGSQLDIEDLDDSQFGEWGAALVSLHSAVQSDACSALSSPHTWRDHL